MTSETALAIVKGDVKVRRTDKPIHIYLRYRDTGPAWVPLSRRSYTRALPSWPGRPVCVCHQEWPGPEGQRGHNWLVVEPLTSGLLGWGNTRADALARADAMAGRMGVRFLDGEIWDGLFRVGLSPAFEVVQ